MTNYRNIYDLFSHGFQHAVAGTPQDCIEQLEMYEKEYDVDYVIMRFRLPGGPERERVLPSATISMATPFSLPAGASQTFTVRFSPTSSGTAYGVIRVKSGGGNAQVDLRGNALRAPLGRR